MGPVAREGELVVQDCAAHLDAPAVRRVGRGARVLERAVKAEGARGLFLAGAGVVYFFAFASLFD